jgi:CoA transferase family III
MALTGLPDRPLGPPEGLVEGIERFGRPFAGLDAPALLGERAVHMGLWRRGTTSCGGSCRLIPAAEGWLAVSLPRAEDVESVPAWLELARVPSTTPATWAAVSEAVSGRDPDELVARAALLGLPVSRVGEASGGEVGDGVRRTHLGAASPRAVRGLRVVDLSALWAGPLCGDLLAGAGASVIKVESTARPDGARRGPAAFFDLLNARKRSVALDLRSHQGAVLLGRLVQQADVVIEASRPRALEQLGLRAADVVAAGGPRVWISITGHGREGVGSERVGFGDDAAAAGGMVVRPPDAGGRDAPMFCADAVADPLSGLRAAGACLEALGEGGRWLLDVSMAGVCAALAGPTLPASPGMTVSEPRARVAPGAAPALGADTAAVLEELGFSV